MACEPGTSNGHHHYQLLNLHNINNSNHHNGRSGGPHESISNNVSKMSAATGSADNRIIQHLLVVNLNNNNNNIEKSRGPDVSKMSAATVDIVPAEKPDFPCRDFVYPQFDKTLFDDDRVLLNLLKAEDRRPGPGPGGRHVISFDYFRCVQTEVKEHMRRTLTEWMFEVSEEERCDCEVFPLAVSYLDRFLSIEAVHKAQLQVLGTACLFVASKIKQPQPLCARRLVDYSAQSVGLNELMSWELLLLNRLKWDLATVTTGDILDHLLHRLRLPACLEHKLRPHLQYLIALLATEFRLAILPPSILAVSCLCVQFARLLSDPEAKYRMLHALQPILKVDTYAYEPYVEAVQAFALNVLMKNHHRNNLAGITTPDNVNDQQINSNDNDNHKSPHHISSAMSTPTDIRDVELP